MNTTQTDITKTHKKDEKLCIFPDRQVTEAELREILQGEDEKERLWAISQLLLYVQWEELWSYVSREEVRDVLPKLEIPDGLRASLGRML